MAANPSYGARIDAMLHDHLHSEGFRDRVADAAHSADAAVKAELAPFTATGTLMRDSSAQVSEFAAGWGMLVSSIFRGFFVANKKGIRRTRLGGDSSAAIQRAGRGVHQKAALKVGRPSVFGESVKVFGESVGVFEGE